jgi:predicted nuclease of predicted toxin-antitoxin system
VKVLLDENIDKKLKAMLSEPDIDCQTVREVGYRGKKNGDLLALVEGLYDVFVTMDKSIRKQQNLRGRQIALLLVRAQSNRIKDVVPYVQDIKNALRNIKPGQFREVGWTKSAESSAKQ